MALITLQNIFFLFPNRPAGKDFMFPMELRLGTNEYNNRGPEKTEVISLESFDKIEWKPYVFRKFFRIIHKTPILDSNMGGSDLIVSYDHKNQNDSKVWKNPQKQHLMSQLLAGDMAYFTITSKVNSPGIIYETWKDGNPFMITINKNTAARYYIQPEKYRFLSHDKKCQQESYYGCIAKQLDINEFKDCSKKCMPRIFSNLGINYSIPFCHLNDTEAEQCALDIGKNIVEQKISSNCKKSCSNLRYFGDMSGINPVSPPSKNKKIKWYFFTYILTNDEFISNVFEEYLIYDVIGMIGSVGGTLGKLFEMKK